jgi:YVTN family beta-propeller protein
MRFLPAGLLLLALAAPASSATLVVLNKAEATASLIDLDSGKVVATLPTGEGPHEVAVSPDGQRALVANYGTPEAPGSTLTVLDVAGARVVRTIALGDYRRPHGVAFFRDGARAAVTAEAQKALLVVDVERGALLKAIPTGQEVSHMVVLTPDGGRAFVANIGSGTVTALDLEAGKVLEHISTGAGAEGIDLTPDGRELWVTNREADTVSVVDTATLKVVTSIESKSFPIRARTTPDGAHMLVSNARSGNVVVFDAKKRTLLRGIALDPGPARAEGRLLDFGKSSVPIGIAISPDGKRAFVAHANADAISVIDLQTFTAAGTLKAGKEPDGMATSPVTVSR